jgi:hypothetical protein
MSTGASMSVLRLTKHVDNKVKNLMTLGFDAVRKKNTPDVPPPGTSYEMVVEVCKDGSQHPFAWAKLPDTGGFKNSTQANSFAVRIEWQDPPDSGNWRYNYLRATVM